MFACPWCSRGGPCVFAPPAGWCVSGDGGLVCGGCGRCQRNDRHRQDQGGGTMSTPRQVQTSIHGPGFHMCGIRPEPTEDRVALRRDYHPGFGGVSLLRDEEHVWGAVRWEDSRTLGWIERTHVTDEPGTWRLRIDGPMVSYTLVRRRPKFWVLESSEDGFA